MTDTQTDIIDPENPLPPVAISDLSEKLRAGVRRAGWTQLTPVQTRAIPYQQAGRDMMVQARTGSGKTGAFVLPLLEQLDPGKTSCQALILVPTRELAQQVASEAHMLAGEGSLNVVPVYGGASYRPQIEGFKRGAHIVVGTPGRVLDHLIKRNLRLDDLHTLIYDEADRMMSMGFYPDMVRVREFLPEKPVNSMMFSATFPAQVMRMAKIFMRQPEFLSLSRDHVYVEDTEHLFYETPRMGKERALVKVIEVENPSQTIIFCNTKDQVFFVTRVLQRFGFNADQLSSDLNQKTRDKVLDRLREGKLRFLVATDVAARGIDVPELSHVIQYEPPEELELYIHRAGRTGRAGASGKAIMLVDVGERRKLTQLAAKYGIEFEELPLPDDEAIETLVAERLTSRLEALLRERDKLQIERMQRFIPLVEDLVGEEEGPALLAMLLDDTYHEWMHQPPELPPVGTASKPKKHGRRRSGGKRRRR